MDYLEHADIRRNESWQSFAAGRPAGRLVLLTTRAASPYTAFRFAADDTLLLGRETKGAPDYVHAAADARLVIPIRPGLRSINVATAAAMVLGEALRQLDGFPRHPNQQEWHLPS